MSSIYFALTFLGLSIFTLSIIYEGIIGINNLVFFFGSSLGITGAFFSLLFWEAIKTRNIFNRITLLGGILYGLSISSLLIYCIERPTTSISRLITSIMQLALYTYISIVAFYVLYLMNKLSRHELIKKQMKIFTITALIGYGYTDLFLILGLLNIINWRYVFIIYTLIASLMVLLYIKNPLLFIYLPESLYEIKDFNLEKIMLTTLNGELIWSSGRRDAIKKGVEDELVSNLITALEIFGQETLNVKPKLNVLSIRINNKVLYIKRYREIQCMVIANIIPKILEIYLNSYLRKVYKVIPINELPKLSKEIQEAITTIYKHEFKYLLMLRGEVTNIDAK